MNTTRKIETQCTHAEFFRNLPSAIDNKPFEVVGNRVVVYDQDKQINITVNEQPIKELGSLSLPMEKIEFEFSGYSDNDADDFMENYRQHNFRCGGG